MRIRLELLAPARNTDIGIAAIDCGADAVYIAGPSFGARGGASNTVEDIARLSTYAHRFGARVYVVVNTILYDDELRQAFRMMEECAQAGCDAFIIQDLAIFRHFAQREDFPPLFASTQCAIRTPSQARWLESLGAERIILERQLTLNEISEIGKAVSADIECFVHGALCVSYSGNCYLSEYLCGRSANRGECIQACRSQYDLTDSRGRTLVSGKALLSLKDLSLHRRLEDLIDAGVTSFKIEGRLKNASYVKNVVRAYRMALDSIIARRNGEFERQSFGSIEGGFTPQLGKTFNRGYTELSIDGNAPGWSSMDSSNSIGEPLGKIISTESSGKNTIITVSTNKTISNGDGLCIITPKGVIGFRADVCRGNTVTVKSLPQITKGAQIYRNLDTAFEKQLESNAPRRLLENNVLIKVTRTDKDRWLIECTASCENGHCADISVEDRFEPARDTAKARETFAAQISKTYSIYRFHLKELHGSEIPFVPASVLNGLRRDLAAKLDAIATPVQSKAAHTLKAKPESSWKPVFDYRANCANALAAQIYEQACGFKADDAYEITRTSDAELMRARYCIKRELGMCPKFGGKLKVSEPLFLINNGRKLRLIFDCARCEMVVTTALE